MERASLVGSEFPITVSILAEDGDLLSGSALERIQALRTGRDYRMPSNPLKPGTVLVTNQQSCGGY